MSLGDGRRASGEVQAHVATRQDSSLSTSKTIEVSACPARARAKGTSTAGARVVPTPGPWRRLRAARQWPGAQAPLRVAAAARLNRGG
jgi:hypothetical protein